MVQIPDEYMNPPMMAIGDSLYNGVRSLTIKHGLAQLSAPVLIAQALGIRDKFSCPDLGRPVLIDMEKWLHMFPDIGDIRADLKANTDHWLPGPTSSSRRLFFENIAIASSDIPLMLDDSWETANDRLDDIVRDNPDTIGTFDAPLADMFLAINSKFTLDPMAEDDFKSCSQMRLVELRQPRRLLINIGSNHGLWRIVFEGNSRVQVRLTKLRTLAKRLDNLPDTVEHIYFNNLGVPSPIANLMPIPDYAEYQAPPQGGYYRKYENRFGLKYGVITGDRLRELDQHVASVNAAAKQTILSNVRNPDRIHFVDVADLLRDFDRKHEGATPDNTLGIDGKTFSNVMLEADPWPLPRFRTGGLFGLDGMHLTTVGYGLMARRVLDAIRQHEGDAPEGVAIQDIDFDELYRKDKLLQKVPRSWSYVLWIWRDIRRATARKEPSAAESGGKEADVDEMMSAICRRNRG